MCRLGMLAPLASQENSRRDAEGCADHSQRDMQPADASVLESQDLISLSFFMEMIPLACEGSSQPGSALHVEGQGGSR